MTVALSPLISFIEIIFPETVSGNENAGAAVLNAIISEYVLAMVQSYAKVC